MSARKYVLHRFRPVVSSITAAALVFAQLPTAQAASAMTRADYEACQARDEQGFRVAVEALTRRSLEAGIAGFDYKAVVNDEWRRGNVDDVIDRQVDQAIGELRDESSWMQLWQTLASQQKARELATTAAERVYRSDAMKKALEGVATGIGKEIGKRIELATVDTAGPATQCVQAFLGPRYGATIARIVATGTGREYGVDPVKGTAQVSTGQVIVEGTDALAGTVVLLVRRQLANMASRIGQRVVGSILGRLVSMVAGGVGLVLIAKDIWDFRHGVLPIIGTEMKSKETKDKVREELAKSVSEQIGDSIKEISGKTADRVLEIWLEFRRAHAKVVELADRAEVFKRFLDTVKPDDLPKLDEVVALVLASEGEAGIIRAPRQRHAAPRRQRPADRRHRDRPRDAIAGDGAAVVGGGRRQPRQGGRVRDLPAGQARHLHQGKPAAAARPAGPGGRHRGSPRCSRRRATRCSSCDANELKALARTLDETQLDSLSRYLTGLDKSSAQRVLHVVGADARPHGRARQAERARCDPVEQRPGGRASA